MNIKKVRNIITLYKHYFVEINKQEIYKWRAIKCFQENWNIEATDFTEMLDTSLALAKNLLASGQYFAKRMLVQYSQKEPEILRNLFLILYNEDEDLIERIKNFQTGIRLLNKQYFPRAKDFQDPRAILVYLTLRFPDRYFLYKFEMFNKFVDLIEYPYKPKKGAFENIIQYLSLCDILKQEIYMDAELLKLNKTRITDSEYHDMSHNILTQDIIYAAVRHLDKFKQAGRLLPASKRLILEKKKLKLVKDKPILKGSFTNFNENEKANKKIGDLGELLVMEYEMERLLKFKIRKLPVHSSKSYGDGLGYDIKSYDKSGNTIYIEVKTTKHKHSTPFYLTRSEVEFSKINKDAYYLYRLYEFKEAANSAKFFIKEGSLVELTDNPILYKAILK